MNNKSLLLAITISILALSSLGQVHKIGENYAGGIVFYISDSSGQHGLIAALTDQNEGIHLAQVFRRVT